MKLRKGVRRKTRSTASAAAGRGFEQLESRLALSANPVLSVVGPQTANEFAPLSISNVGTFSDVAEFEGVTTGLNPLDYTSLGFFDPPEDAPSDPLDPTSFVASVYINTDTLEISGGFSGTGVIETANVGYGDFQIAVFTFSDFELDGGATIVATGSRPLALLSHGDMSISGTIDVSAKYYGNYVPSTPGAGGGAGGGDGPNSGFSGYAAAGAPTLAGGQVGNSTNTNGGSGGGFGGAGGRGQGYGGPTSTGAGIAYADLETAIQGGSGGARGYFNSSTVPYGGAGGGGVELGAVHTVTIDSSGRVLADGAKGGGIFSGGLDPIAAGGGAGGGILVHGTNVTQNGTLSAVGGKGGESGGGGGGGGEIMIVHSAIGTFVHGGTEDVSGGANQADDAAEDGQAGNATVRAESPVNYSIDWGDGSTPDAGPTVIDTPGLSIGDTVAGFFGGRHTYADDGVYTVTVTLTDIGGGSGVETFTVTVNNVDPILTLGKSLVSAAVGQTAHNSGTFYDVPEDTVTLSASIGTVTQDTLGVWQWTHTVAAGDPPAQTVTITATDEDGGSKFVTFNIAGAGAGDSPDPVLTVVDNQTVDEGVRLSITDLGTFTDAGQSAGESTGLDAADYNAIGDFKNIALDAPADPEVPDGPKAPSVLIDTDSLTVSGGFSGRGSIELADIGFGVFEIAVFAFSDFELVYGATIRAKGSRPLALLSQAGMVVAGTIDVSAYNGDLNQWNAERIAGPGGGNGGLGSNDLLARQNGSPAAGAPAGSVGTPGFREFAGGAGGGFGGEGGQAEGNNSGTSLIATGTAGLAYGDLATAIQGGSGGATARSGNPNGGGNLYGGGGGGGGIELGAAGTLTVASSGRVLADGGRGKDGSSFNNVGGGGGGAGGGILLHAANVNQRGTLSARGGEAGFNSRNGGGGGGGRILVVHSSSGTFDNTGGIQDALGGQKQFPSDVNEAGETGQVGIISETPTSTPVVETFDYVIDWGDNSPVDTDSATIDASGAGNGGVEGSFDGGHPYADDGEYTVTVTINDSGGGSDTRTFIVTVENVAPTADAGGAYTLAEGGSVTLTATGSDVPADTLSFAWDLDNDGVYDDATGVTATFDAAGLDGPAVATASVRVSDDDGGVATSSAAITVTNVAPTADAGGAYTVAEGGSVTLTATGGDVPGDALAYAWDLDGDDVYETVGASVVFSAAVLDGPAVVSVNVRVTDDEGDFATSAATITVTNVAPTADAGGAYTVAEGGSVTLTATGSDVPGDALSFAWDLDNDGEYDDATGATATYDASGLDGPAVATASVRVTDDEGDFATSAATITVTNVAPTAEAGGAYLTFDDTAVTLTGAGSDVAGAADPLSYSWDLNNDGVFEASGATVSFNPEAFGIVGTQNWTVQFKVVDDDGGEALDSATVQVIGEGTLLLDGVLYVVGDRDAGDLVLITQWDSSIHVLATYDNNVPSVFPADDVDRIVVRTRGGHDVAITTSNVVKTMTIDGGDGNDLLKGGGGENEIRGSAGHDTLYGSAGDDVLLGGDGDDDLLGFGGNDALVGGEGRDIVNGGDGRDLLIGGANEDRLHGGTSDDILIGGYTSHDEDLAALDSIMAVWGSDDSFDDRVAMLTNAGGWLVAGETVFDDDAKDTIIGSAGRDLAFADTSKDWDGVKDTAALSPAKDTLIALS